MLKAIRLAVLLLPLAAIAGEIRQFPLGDAGVLQIDIEPGWKESSSAPKPTLSFESKVPGRLHLLLTPMPETVEPRSDRDVRELVQGAANRVGPATVEKTLALQSMKGAQARGYYFKATDATPKPGEYVFMYQGMVTIDRSLVTFTVLHNPGAEREAEMALSAIRRLKLVSRGRAQ